MADEEASAACMHHVALVLYKFFTFILMDDMIDGPTSVAVVRTLLILGFGRLRPPSRTLFYVTVSRMLVVGALL